MPGVTYQPTARFTPAGVVALHVVTAPRPVGLYSLGPALSNGTIVDRQTVSSMERSLASQGTSVGVNGDFFNWRGGYPTGILVRNGVLDHQSHPGRSSLGIDAEGTLHVDRVQTSGSWRGLAGSHPIGALNDLPAANGTALYTQTWGHTTPAARGTLEATLAPLPPTVPGAQLSAPVVDVRLGGRTPIPPGAAVLVARGRAVDALLTEAPPGQTVTVRVGFTPWAGIVGAVGGGPLLVKDGRGQVGLGEALTRTQLRSREPRTAVGQRADGRIVMITADGRRLASAGVTNFELAAELVRRGCVTGMALDSGGSSTLAFDGKVLNNPSDTGGERPVAEALLLTYAGAYAPVPAGVLSPNGDGLADRESLSYRLVRPATVNAVLVAPDGSTRALDSGARRAGRYRFTWPGTARDGSVEPEGTWHWHVDAVDDLGRTSTIDRSFRLDTTVGFVTTRVVRHRVVVRFRLARPADVRLAVTGAGGDPLRRVKVGERASGPVATSFPARDARGRRLRGGYRLAIRAASEVGTSEIDVRLRVSR